MFRLAIQDNPLTNPTHDQTKALQTLEAALAKDVSAAGLVRPAEGATTLQAVPDVYSGFLRTIERLFGVSIQFVHAEGLAKGVGFVDLCRFGGQLADWVICITTYQVSASKTCTQMCTHSTRYD